MPGPDLRRRVELARYEAKHGSKKKAERRWRSARKAAIKLLRAGKSFTHLEKIANVSRQWLHTWHDRWIHGGKTWKALEAKPSTPQTIHTKRDQFVQVILETRTEHPYYGAHKIQHVAGLKDKLSHTSINQVLRDLGLTKTPKKRRKPKWKRFQRPRPNDLWQLDITQWPLNNGDGPWAWVLTILDDHSRMVLATGVFDKEVDAADAIQLYKNAITQWGAPKQSLTDNGWPFETISDDPTLFTLVLQAHGVHHITTRPKHPRCIGKIERWHGTLKQELLRIIDACKTHDELRERLHAWVDHYNNERPHWALDLHTPLEAYAGAFIPTHGFKRFVNEDP